MKIVRNAEELKSVFKRSQLEYSELNEQVRDIVKNVKQRGDEALFEYCQKFDETELNSSNICVSEEEFEQAYNDVSAKLLSSLRKAKKRILDYHKSKLQKMNITTKEDKSIGFVVRACERAGIYVPGGTAAYPSSVLMGVLPALAAGCEEIYVVTPCKKGKINSLTLVACKECGVTKVYKIGGAQAISALAFGTDSVKKVDVIAGPGNIYVTLAKKEVYGFVGIDMLAGPSEILIIADDSAKANFVAADMLSQSEHDKLATAVLVTTSEKLAEEVLAQLDIQLQKLPRKEIAMESLENNGAIIIVDNLDDAMTISNEIAPEHLELCVANPEGLLAKVRNAGAVFLGNYTPEPIGDYFAGPNHVLPTSGSAKFFEVLNSDIFMKKISVLKYSEKALKNDAYDVIQLAKSEGLFAHANSVEIRLKNSNN